MPQKRQESPSWVGCRCGATGWVVPIMFNENTSVLGLQVFLRSLNRLENIIDNQVINTPLYALFSSETKISYFVIRTLNNIQCENSWSLTLTFCNSRSRTPQNAAVPRQGYSVWRTQQPSFFVSFFVIKARICMSTTSANAGETVNTAFPLVPICFSATPQATPSSSRSFLSSGHAISSFVIMQEYQVCAVLKQTHIKSNN